MAAPTTQQLHRFYEAFRDIEVTFTKPVVRVTGILPDQVHLKILGDQWPCVPYSASMKAARVIAQMKSGYFETLKEAKNIVSLRLAFNKTDLKDTLFFFVPAKVASYSPYNSDNSNFHFLNLDFTQKPPDDYIEVLGGLLDANSNAQKRKQERVVITPSSLTELGLTSKDIVVEIESLPRKGILRDLSFSGAKVLTVGVGKFLVDKPAQVRLEFDAGTGIVEIPGKIVRYEAVTGRRDISALAIDFDLETVPLDYKLRLNEYLKGVR